MIKLSLYTYYSQPSENKTPFNKNFIRQICDPNRIYDAKPIRLTPIKGVRIS